MGTPDRRLAYERDMPLGNEREAQGKPEYTRELAHERQIGLHVIGTFGITLGILGIRCERYRGRLVPISMTIADTPMRVDDVDPAQSNPRRVPDEDGA